VTKVAPQLQRRSRGAPVFSDGSHVHPLVGGERFSDCNCVSNVRHLSYDLYVVKDRQ
jgi:hypothetical protein